MGSLFSGKTTTKNEPWKPQGAALQDIFSQAASNFNSQSGTPFYENELYAQMDPQSRAAVQRMIDHSQGQGQQNADRVTQTGAAMADPNAYNQSIGNFASMAGQDPTQANIAAATAYANNPATDGMIDAASRDVTRNLYENEIPGINRAGTASGNINSSRAGVAQGIAERGAGDRVADISSSIRGQAYDRGLGLAEQSRGTNLSAMGQTAGLYGQQLGMGVDALQAGNSMTQGNMGNAIDASKLYQNDQQGQLDAKYAKWQGNDTRQTDLLNRYYGTIGASNWGGTTVQKSTPSIAGTVMGLASTAAAFSDPRLKENVQKIAEMEDGLGVYTYDYIWGEPSVGVMADEVAELRPWALGPTLGGFNTVNYAAL